MKPRPNAIRTTCPRDCYDSCGMLAILDDTGAVSRIIGDPDHHMSRGVLCAKCTLAYNGAWRDPQVRLSSPLRRVGRKGEGRFEPVSWDVALQEIAGRLKAISAERGAAHILHSHYTGTCGVLGGLFPMRFFHRLGATEVAPDTICNNAAHAALISMFGASLEGFDPDFIDDTDCVVIWGANPSAAAPHVHDHWVGRGRASTIVIDPVSHRTAKKADLHLQLRPGSDAALAFGLLHLALKAGKIDHAFLSAFTLGWEEVAPDVLASTPDVTAAKTGLQVAQIEACAELYLKGRALLWLGQGLQRQKAGGNIYRACALLAVATGNMSRPGSGLLFLNGANTRGADLDTVTRPDLARAPLQSVGHMRLVETLADRARASALVTWNNNIVGSNPRPAELRDALAREDLFQVSLELFHTDTTAYADYILPAASFLEYDDLLFPYFENTVCALAAVQPPPGAALPNAEIARRLAAALGFDEPALFETDRAVIEAVLRASDAGISFDALKTIGTKRVYTAPRIQFEAKVFATPSGRIEIASAAAEAAGAGRVPTSHVDPPRTGHKVRVLSPASEWTLNTSYANDPKIRRRLGGLSMLINPADAEHHRIADGQEVRLRNAVGTIRVRATLSRDTLPGVVVVPKGHWPLFEGDAGGNVNALNPGEATDMGESSAVHSVEAELLVDAPSA